LLENNLKKETNDAPVSTKQILRFRYRNWRGEVADRAVIPIRTSVGVSVYHNDGNPCWIMTAYDTEKDQIRDFALKDIIQYYDLI
jgi:predicted DNA-binding transcriptional regulator YafY